jgi:hypothetical protein
MATAPQDKETVTESSETGQDAAGRPGAGKESRQGQEPCFPPVSFTTFVLSLAHSAMVLMGEVPDPETGRIARNLAEAKHTIDILAMLDCKTRGNRTDEEGELLSSLLCELRLVFVKKQ